MLIAEHGDGIAKVRVLISIADCNNSTSSSTAGWSFLLSQTGWQLCCVGNVCRYMTLKGMRPALIVFIRYFHTTMDSKVINIVNMAPKNHCDNINTKNGTEGGIHYGKFITGMGYSAILQSTVALIVATLSRFFFSFSSIILMMLESKVV